MHNKFLVTVVDAMEFIESYAGRAGFSGSGVEVMADIPQLQLVEKAL